MDVFVLLAALCLGVADGASVRGSSPYWLGFKGGVTLQITGSGFSEDQFNFFDSSLGNVVKLVNEADTINCTIIQYLTNTEQIYCSTGPKVNTNAPVVYAIKVYVDGVEASGSRTVRYGHGHAPSINTVRPARSLPGTLLEVRGSFKTGRYKVPNIDDPLEDDLSSGSVITKVYVGNVDCDVYDDATGEMYATLTSSSITCQPTSKNIGPMNATIYVTERGASSNDRNGLYVDSQDRLYNTHTYGGISSVSPSTGSPAGNTLITVSGIGFNEAPGATEVFVGGAPCKIQTIEYESLTCLTPAEDETSPGSRERGYLFEMWADTFIDISSDDAWGALDQSSPNYSSESGLDLEFNFNVTTPSTFKVSGYLHGAHPGEYSLAIHADDSWSRIYVATDGNPDNMVFVDHWEIFNLMEDTPAYFEIRWRCQEIGLKLFKVYMNDFDTIYTSGYSFMAHNEKHRYELEFDVAWDTQLITPVSSPVASSLYLGGYLSDPVDVTDADQVREAIFGLLDQQCDVSADDPSYEKWTSYEEGDLMPDGHRGSVVSDTEPFCGRKSFKPHTTDPKLYDQGNTANMVSMNDYNYLCFALKGNVVNRMRVFTHWWDKWNRWRWDDVWFDHTFTSNENTWSYQCFNMIDIISNHWISTQRNDGDILYYRRVYSPLRASDRDDVYVDSFTFSNENIAVSQTRPSALNPQGVLISDVIVTPVEVDSVTSLQVQFESWNCRGNLPLLGVTDGAANPSWATDLDSSATNHVFTVAGGSVEVTRTIVATNPMQGTWDMNIMDTTITGISPDVKAKPLEDMIEAALGSSGMSVSRSGTCYRRKWVVEWQQDPGRKPLGSVDDSLLSSDADSFSFDVTRHGEGKIWHSPLFSDFVTVHRSEPSVSININGYSAACIGDCSYSYDSAGVPSLSSVAGSMESGSGVYTFTIMGSDFSSSDISDYAVKVGMADGVVTAVTSTSVTCTVAYLPAGVHGVSVVMQPYGAAIQPDPALSYQVSLSITSVTPSTGGTGGGYSMALGGSGFPADLLGWSDNTVSVGGTDCDIVGADATSVSFIAPAGAEGTADVAINVNGQTATLSAGFTYDAALSASISSASPTTSSVLGGDELSIVGSNFGDGTERTSGYVKVGDNMCDVTSWTDTLITCTLPMNDPGVQAVTVYTGTGGFATGSASVTYTLKVTASSETTGSINGGTILVIDGEGFGTDCSLLMVEIGSGMACDITECSDTQITCITKLVSKNHVITNTGSYPGFGVGYAWSPKILTINVGDSVTWTWSKINSFSQLLYNVYQTASATDNVYDGSGFHSGSVTTAGSFTASFKYPGVNYFTGDPIVEIDVSNTVRMTGQINVVRPSEEAHKVMVTLGGVEAEYVPSGGSPSVTVDGCASLLSSPMDGCSSTAPSAPDSDYLYFITDLCHTPTVTGISASAVENIDGLVGLQVRSGVTLTLSGMGFGTIACQTTVMVGLAACTVTASSDDSITCILDDNGISLTPNPVVVTVANRGTASVSISDYVRSGQITVVPVVDSFTPTQGSVAGGTIITISGSGLKAFDGMASVMLNTGSCMVETVTTTAITCKTVATSASTVTLAVVVSAYNIPAFDEMSSSSYTFSEAITPMIDVVTVSVDIVTITGSSFGTTIEDVTVTLMPSSSRHKESIDEIVLEKAKPAETKPVYQVEFDDDEEVHVYDKEAEEEESRSTRRPRLRLDLIDPLDLTSDFWGILTKSKAKTYEESKRLGAWMFAGSKAPTPSSPVESDEGIDSKVKRSVLKQAATHTLTVTSVTPTTIVATTSGIASSNYAVGVSIAGVGSAQVSGSATATVSPIISSINPTQGSTNGNALLKVDGSGFTPGDVSVTIDGVDCPLDSEATNTLTCWVPPHAAGDVPVVVTSSSVASTSVDFTYSSAVTPILTSVVPSSGIIAGDTLTLTGSGFMVSGSDPTVSFGDMDCTVVTASDTSVTCTAPDIGGGSQSVILEESTYGDSNEISVTYDFSLTSISPTSGGFGGALVTLAGTGFDPVGRSSVSVCGFSCDMVSSTSSSIECLAPPYSGGGTNVPCDVEVSNPDGSLATLVSGFTYNQALTPAVTSVSPKRGGTAGGTTLTITGTDFSVSGNEVTIGGSLCVISTESTTEITCVTEAHAGPGTFPVVVNCPGLGFASTDENAEFFYIDRWSSVYTWGGNPVPTAGKLVVIEEGQTVLFDQSSDVLSVLIIEGGHLIFDDEASEELVLRAEYILIVNGGSLSIGSEDEPFMNDAVIEMHGNTQSIELPHYGAKVLAVRNGTLDLHGAHVPITWTHLAQTANAGDTTITLKQAVTWKAGDRIIIATTEHRFSANENEERTIASVSADGLTLTLTEALEHEHISIEQTLGGRVIETRAEVGLLTRNVKFRGNVNADFSVELEACGETFDVDQFATQSCFNGRYGEETGSDQFGAHIMIFSKYPNQDLVAARIEYVEVTEAGQAFQLGRYPIHYHLVGNMTTSYVRGCGIHRTYNRAVTLHAVDYLTVERNVVYNNMGHAIFTEDGNEQFNTIQYNLAIFTRTSSSLLNVDITPSSYWVVNPNNNVRHNAAAGGTHFGYWYRLERHPSGPSATTSYCQNNAPMGEFFNNTAHSIGRYGLWVFSMDGYFPMDETCGGQDTVAAWYDFTVWRCDRGAEVVFGGALQFHNFVALDNEHAGLEMVKVKGGFGVDDGPGVFDSLLIGHSALSDGSCGDGASGIIAPKQDIFSISNTKFVNYDTGTCAALSGCSQCKPRQGGFRSQVEGLSFENSPNKLKFEWEYETIWIDVDGSLSGTAENVVVPSMGILPPSSCQMDVAEFSVNPEVPGAVCQGLKFLRVNVKGPSIIPDSLQGRDIIVTNSYGNTSLPYRIKRLTTEGWMGILYAGETYNWAFDYSSQITNISYAAETRFMTPGDYYFVEHELMQKPDSFGTLGSQSNSSDAMPNPATAFHGDYYWDNDTHTMTYLVSESVSSRRRSVVFDNRLEGSQRNINFNVYRCFFTDCITPTPPPVPTGRPSVTFRWSDNETWAEVPVGSGGHPTEDVYGLPVAGDEIIIPPGMWLIVDTATPPLGRVYVYGAIEFEDGMHHTFEATIIYIQGGTVVAGFSEDSPFNHNLNIILRGSLDRRDPDNEDMPMPPGIPNVGWKAMGVFGQLILHGNYQGETWLKLGASAVAGDTTLTLAEAADSSWLNKEVMITTTSKEAKETEIRTVTAVSGTTLTLDSALTYDHLAETFSIADGTSFTMAAEVGVMTRNIRIEGNDYADLDEDSFGGRIVVSQLNQDGVDYVGSAQLYNVEFKHMGQEGFTDTNDPRYSLAFWGLGVNDGSSYVTRCSFNKNFNTAIGLFGTDNVTIEDNVIYHTVGPCIRDDSSDNTHRGNLLSTMLFPGTYNGRFEVQDLDWFGAFALKKATGVVLENNVVGGSEQAGFQTYGELCDDDTLWLNNEVHSSLFGVMVWHKGAGSSELECRRLNNFYAWRVWDTAFYMQHYPSYVVTGVKVVDCHVGVNQLIYSPPSLSHKFLDKRAVIEDATFVGASPYHTCDYQQSKADIFDFEGHVVWKDGLNGGHTGVVAASFISGKNLAPKSSFHGISSYPALYGTTIIRDVTYANYDTRSCGTDVAIMTSPKSDDAIHPIFTSGLTFLATPSDNYVHFATPNLGPINPSDCVDMTCDGHKKSILTDMDGTLLGDVNATLTAKAEYEWDGDPRHGVGDYRIPVSLRQNKDGSAITAAEKFPNKGIVRDDSCTLMSAWQGWKCTTLRHRMMIIESMDSDTEIRRLSPIALIADPGTDGYVDLLNGPQDHGWCFGYTCQERISTFFSVVASGYTYEMAMTSTPPQVIRFHLLHSDPSETFLLRIFFPKTQRYDIYVDDVFVNPTNIDNSSSSYKLLPENPSSPEAFFPTHSDPVGSNYLQRNEKMLHVLLRGGHIIDIKTSPTIVLTTGVVVDPDNFFEENVVANVAAMLGISPDNIVVTNVIREDSGRRKRSGTETVTMSFDIASAPTTNIDGGSGAASGEVLSFDELEGKLSNFVDAYQSGSCTNCNLTIATVEVVEPVPPPEEPGEPATQESGSVVVAGGELFSNVQQQEEAEELAEDLEGTAYLEPSRSVVVQGVSTREKALTRFTVQPHISVQAAGGVTIGSLGHFSDPWKVRPILVGGPRGARLLGNSPVDYMDGYANFTNLSVTKPGKFSLAFRVVYPSSAPSLGVPLGYSFRAARKSVAIRVSSYPDYVNALKPFSLSLYLEDLDTGKPMDRAQLDGQTLKGKIQLLNKKKKEGRLIGKTRFTIRGGDISNFTVDGLRLTEAGTNFILGIKVAVTPADLRSYVKTEGLNVLKKDLVISENSITRRISMKGIRGKAKAVKGNEKEFGNKLYHQLSEKVGRAFWSDIKVKVGQRPSATLKLVGSKTQVSKAIGNLCSKLKNKKIKFRVKGQRFYMSQLHVNGKLLKRCNPSK